MNIDLFQAIRYPFRQENRLNTIFIPTCLLLANGLLTTMVNNVVIQSVLLFTLNTLAAGFFWELSKQFRINGMDSSLKSWDFVTFSLNGCKVLLYLLIVNALLYIALAGPFGHFFAEDSNYLWAAWIVCACLFVYTAPVIFAPIIYAAETQDLKSLFNIKEIQHFIAPRYGQCNQAILYVLFLTVLYVIAFIIILNLLMLANLSALTLLVIPIGLAPMQVSLWHLINQGFLNPLEKA